MPPARCNGPGVIIPMSRCFHSYHNDIRDRLISIRGWFDRIDPGTHRRIKGLRLVTAYGLAAMLATVPDITGGRPTAVLVTLASGFALWASVSEARTTRYESARDRFLLCLAGGGGAGSFALLAPCLGAWTELI